MFKYGEVSVVGSESLMMMRKTAKVRKTAMKVPIVSLESKGRM